MRPILSSVFAVIAGALVASACYAERQPPPSFRYACDGDSDCREGQACVDGLCETPCTTETLADDCTNGELLCLNGVCSSSCDLAADNCPSPQACVDLGIQPSGGGGFLGGGDSDVAVGVCMRPCSDDSCGEMFVCLEGFCVQTCTEEVQCPASFVCTSGLCIPDLGGTTTGGETTMSDSLTITIGTESEAGTDVDTGLDTATATGGAT